MINFNCFEFDDLSNKMLYDILRLRTQIFVLEQKCLYQDMDNLDKKAYHIVLEEHNEIIGYSRIINKKEYYKNFCSIGRVMVKEKERKKEIGNKLVNYSIKKTKHIFNNAPIKISAQSYLIKFYEKIGFQYKGEDYLEDGIPHCAMYLE